LDRKAGVFFNTQCQVSSIDVMQLLYHSVFFLNFKVSKSVCTYWSYLQENY